MYSKAFFCGLLLAGITGSNPGGGVYVHGCLFREF
jgi:hypothetical protein